VFGVLGGDALERDVSWFSRERQVSLRAIEHGGTVMCADRR
jgi:hypothetical protein